MYNVEFYETQDGKSQIWEFLEDLRIKSSYQQGCPYPTQTSQLVY